MAEPLTEGVVQAPRRYRIVLMGDTQILAVHHSRPGLQYLLDRLLGGQAVSVRAFRSWGITIEVADDTDQGPESLDNLIGPADFSRR